MTREQKAKAQKFVREYLTKKTTGTDILDSEFIDGFIEATGCKFYPQFIGAHSCKEAGRTLGSMYRDGILKRATINLGSNWMPGFPKWVYTYRLTAINEELR